MSVGTRLERLKRLTHQPQWVFQLVAVEGMSPIPGMLAADLCVQHKFNFREQDTWHFPEFKVGRHSLDSGKMTQDGQDSSHYAYQLLYTSRAYRDDEVECIEPDSLIVRNAYWDAIRRVDPEFGYRNLTGGGQLYIQASGYYVSEYDPILFPDDELEKFYPYDLAGLGEVMPNIDNIEL